MTARPRGRYRIPSPFALLGEVPMFRSTVTLLLLTATATLAQPIRVLSGHSEAVTAVAFRPDGEQLASASFDRSVRVWEADTGAVVCICRGHAGKVTTLAYRPDGAVLASAGLDHSIRLWNAGTGRRRGVVPTSERAVHALAFTRDGRHLLAAGESGVVEVFDVATKRSVRRVALSTKPLYALALSPDGATFASAGEEGQVYVVACDTGTRVRTLPGEGGNVYSLAFAGKDRLLVGLDSGGIAAWDLEREKLLTKYEAHLGAVTQVQSSPDGRRIVTAGADGQVLVRDADSGVILHTHRFPGKALCAALTPDGTHVGTGTAKAECYLMELPRRSR